MEREEDRMRSDLQNIHLQMNATTDQSLESTRRMLQMTEESKDAGIRTLVMLDEQGEQLDRIEGGLDQINSDMKDAEKNLEGLEKCCGLCVLPWKKHRNIEKSKEYNQTWKKSTDGKVGGEGQRAYVNNNSGPATSGQFVTRITNDAREDEMESNLQEVSQHIASLRSMAVDMGNEISQQNRQLDDINRKADSLDTRVNEANKRANKILRS